MNDFLIKTVENELKNIGVLKIHKKSDKDFDFEAIVIYKYKEEIYTKYLYTNYKGKKNPKSWLKERVITELSVGRVQVDKVMYGERFRTEHDKKVYSCIKKQLQNICIINKGRDTFEETFDGATQEHLLEISGTCSEPLLILKDCKQRLESEGLTLEY